MRLIPYTRKSDLPVSSRIFPEISRFFDDFLSDFPVPGWLTSAGESWVPAVDILEKDGNLILEAELPGLKEKDIELRLEGNVLTLRGERKMAKEEKQNDFHRMERYYGTFSRSFTLPDTVESDKIKAEYKNGILVVTIPQKPEVKPREIPVNVGQ